MNKKSKYALLIFVFLSSLIFVGVFFIAPYAILQPPRISEKIGPKDLGLKNSPLIIEVEENLKLQGFFIFQKKDSTRGIIILVHGIGGCKEHFLGLSEKLANQGIASVIFDGRAHGKSDGEYCTYGFFEKKDISKIVDELKIDYPKLPIGIWGNSLGGAISIQALEFDKRIEFGIIESTFSDLSQIKYNLSSR